MNKISSKFSKKRGFIETELDSQKIFIPSYIFKDRRLSIFESLIYHLKDERKLIFSEIAKLLKRDPRNVWTVYDRAREKVLLNEQLTELDKENSVLIPIQVFQDRRVAVLEALVEYLKDVRALSYHEIGIILSRNDRTVWTVHMRVKTKRSVNEIK